MTRSFATRRMPLPSRATALATGAITWGVVQVLGGCGDPMLPSDYVGPPAAEVSGTVFSEGTSVFREARRPQLSLEWLSGLGAAGGNTQLVGQPLRFQRSARIQNDWDIGLGTPPGMATSTPGSGGPRVGVGKMIYFDDRDGDGRLDWSCSGLDRACDEIKAVSREFVAFVDTPVTCAAGLRGEIRQRYSAGYHYFRLNGVTLQKLAPGESMSFVLGDRTLAESDPREELGQFATMLLQLVLRSPLDPC